VAAGVDPIDVNGTLLQRANLKSGDVLRIGSVDITFLGGDDAGGARAPGEASTFDLKPVTSELPSFLEEPDDDEDLEDEVESAEEEVARTAPKRQPVSKSPRPTPKSSDRSSSKREGGDWMSGLAEESRVDLPAQGGVLKSAAEAPAVDQDEFDAEEEEL